MAKKHLKQKTEVHLTDKALRDIASIREYSIQNFGTRVAGKYIAAIEAALARIKAHPALLRSEEGFHPSLARRTSKSSQHPKVSPIVRTQSPETSNTFARKVVNLTTF